MSEESGCPGICLVVATAYAIRTVAVTTRKIVKQFSDLHIAYNLKKNYEKPGSNYLEKNFLHNYGLPKYCQGTSSGTLGTEIFINSPGLAEPRVDSFFESHRITPNRYRIILKSQIGAILSAASPLRSWVFCCSEKKIQRPLGSYIDDLALWLLNFYRTQVLGCKKKNF